MCLWGVVRIFYLGASVSAPFAMRAVAAGGAVG
jgi:hypothetical protein